MASTRSATRSGPHKKLTVAKVRQIRRSYATGRWSQRELGEKYGVHQVTISAVVRGVTWLGVD